MLSDLNTTYKDIKELALFGRYISLKNISPLLHNLPKQLFDISVLGQSVLGNPIYNIEIGNGPVKILMWSQMHGNESTTTKAVFDLLNCIKQNVSMIDGFTLSILPMLNPDGAALYTRQNANKVDLNRDAQDLSQPESVVFREHYISFKPDLCLNLHGQRTIFSAGTTNNTATLSFLAPAEDISRTITTPRKVSMRLIASLNNFLQGLLPNQVGRYDDGFNANCVGDTLTMLSIPTILFEAGHYKNDYNREEVRYFIFQSIVKVLKDVKDEVHINGDASMYADIPENEKLFCDVIITNAMINGELMDIEIQFQEILEDGSVKFEGVVQNISSKASKYAHKYVEAKGNLVYNENKSVLSLNSKVFCVTIAESKILLISE